MKTKTFLTVSIVSYVVYLTIWIGVLVLLAMNIHPILHWIGHAIGEISHGVSESK